MPGSADPWRKGFQGGTRDLIPNRKVLLDMTRLQNILELSWAFSPYHFHACHLGCSSGRTCFLAICVQGFSGHTSISNQIQSLRSVPPNSMPVAPLIQ